MDLLYSISEILRKDKKTNGGEVFSFLAGCFWGKVKRKGSKMKKCCAWGILAAAFVWCSIAVFDCAVNVAYWDEVPVFAALKQGRTADFYWRTHNEHRIVFTKMLMSFGNPLTWIYTSYALYAAMVFQLWRVVRKAAGDKWFLPLLFVPLFSDMNAVNLLWGFTSQFHLMILFSLLAAEFAFLRTDTVVNRLLCLLFLLLSCLSMNIVFAVGVMIAVLVAGDMPKKAALAGFAGVLAIFFIGYPLDAAPAKTEIFSVRYGYYWINVFSAYFTGFDRFSVLHVFLFAVLFLPLIFMFCREADADDKNRMALYAVVFGSLLAAAGIARDRFGDPLMHRHAESVMVCIPALLMLLYPMKKAFLTAVAIVALGYSAHFGTTGFYIIKADRLQGVACVEAFKAGKNGGDCPTLYPYNMARFVF